MANYIFVLATLLSSIAPITTELFAPAMTLAAKELDFYTVEQSVGISLAVSAVLHIFHGWLIEHVGVSVVVLYGLLMYTSSSVIIWSTSIHASFLYLRTMQSVGSSACTVSGYALIRIHLIPKVHIPKVNMCRAMGLVLVPMLSEVMLAYYDWRCTFLTMVLYGALCGTIAVWYTWKKMSQLPSGGKYVQQVHFHPHVFITWVIAEGLSFASTFLWISYAPFLEQKKGFGYWYGFTFVGSAIGAFCAKMFTPWWGFLSGQAGMVILSVICSLLWNNGGDSSIYIFIMMTGFNMMRGISATHAQTQGLMHGPSAGNASGIIHSVRMCVASLAVFSGIYISSWSLMTFLAFGALLIIIIQMCITSDDIDGTKEDNIKSADEPP